MSSEIKIYNTQVLQSDVSRPIRSVAYCTILSDEDRSLAPRRQLLLGTDDGGIGVYSVTAGSTGSSAEFTSSLHLNRRAPVLLLMPFTAQRMLLASIDGELFRLPLPLVSSGDARQVELPSKMHATPHAAAWLEDADGRTLVACLCAQRRVPIYELMHDGKLVHLETLILPEALKSANGPVIQACNGRFIVGSRKEFVSIDPVAMRVARIWTGINAARGWAPIFAAGPGDTVAVVGESGREIIHITLPALFSQATVAAAGITYRSAAQPLRVGGTGEGTRGECTGAAETGPDGAPWAAKVSSRVALNDTPTALIAAAPFLLLHTRGRLEVRIQGGKHILQTLPSADAKVPPPLNLPPRAVAVVPGPITAPTEAGHLIVYCGERSVVQISPQPLTAVLENCRRARLFDGAAVVAAHVDARAPADPRSAPPRRGPPPAAAFSALVTAWRGYAALENGKWADAMSLFDTVDCDPRVVLRCFTGFIDDAEGVQIVAREGHPPRDVPLIAPTTLPSDQYSAAIDRLLQYLVRCHTKITNSPDLPRRRDAAALLAAVDNGIVRALTLLGRNPVDFMVIPNACTVERSAGLLRDNGYLDALIELYRSRGRDRDAVRLLLEQPTMAPAARYLAELAFGPTRETRETAAGPTGRTYALRPEEYVRLHCEAAKVLFQRNADEAAEIYRYPASPGHIPVEPRVAYLLMSEHHVSRDVQIRVLQSVISRSPGAHVEVHTALAVLLVARTLAVAASSGWDPAAPCLVDDTPEPARTARQQLFQHLSETDRYNPRDVAQHIPPEALLHERAVLAARRGDHALALTLLARRIGNMAAALRYCESRGTSEVFQALLHVLLQPPRGSEPLVDEAITIASSYPELVEPEHLLALLPANVPISQLYEFICGSSAALQRRQRAAVVAASLAEVAARRWQAQAAAVLTSSTEVTNSTLCAVCHGRIAAHSHLAYLPTTHAVVHAGCVAAATENAPVTNETALDIS